MSLANMDSIMGPVALAQFQNQFGQYLRQQPDIADADTHTDTGNNSTSAILKRVSQDIPSRVGKLYQSLIFNNICSFLNQCFPVCQSVLDAAQWRELCGVFMAQHPCHSPYFTEINQSFVDFLAQPGQLEQLNLPAYFAELAHYEWVELLVDIHPDVTKAPTQNQPNQPCQLKLNPSLQNLHYQWAVHLISHEYQPDSPEDSFFLVFRNNDDKVEFMQINAMTHALLAFFESKSPIIAQPDTLTEALTDLLHQFAAFIGHEDAQVLVEFGLPLLAQLSEQGVLQYSDND